MKLLFLAPLALLVAPAAAQDATRIHVVLTNFEFTPSTIQLKAGRPYILHLTSSGGHNFEAKAFFAAARLAPTDAAKIRRGRIELEKGESVDVHLIAPVAGSYEVRCTHFLHSTWGMTGKIVVS
jgi:plastocyanin